MTEKIQKKMNKVTEHFIPEEDKKKKIQIKPVNAMAKEFQTKAQTIGDIFVMFFKFEGQLDQKIRNMNKSNKQKGEESDTSLDLNTLYIKPSWFN